MKLYYDPISTTSRVVMLFLAEHDLSVERQIVNLMMGEHYQPQFGAINPNHAVPVLEDCNLRIGECSAIIKYLADVAGSQTYPKALKDRARVNEAMDWFNTFFASDVNKAYVYPQIFPNFAFADEAVQRAVLERGAASAARRFDILDSFMLKDKAFVCGDELTLADYIGAAYVGTTAAIDYDLARYPNVSAWMRRMQARPSWRETHAAFYGLVASARTGQRAAS
jgi:glutathione S-transferase